MAMRERKPGPWECAACTWVNDNEHGLACIMCQTERRIAAPKKRPKNQGGCTTKSSTIKPFSSCGKLPDLRSKSPSTTARGDGDGYGLFASKQYGRAKETPSAQPSRGGEESAVAEEPLKILGRMRNNETGKNRTNEGENEKWDAFASLESNYQSSDDGESGDDDDCNNCVREGNGGEIGNGNGRMGDHSEDDQWDAFKSLEQNYESSEDECGTSSDEDSVGSEECLEEIDIRGEDDDFPSLNKNIGKNASESGVECVDLVDSDEASIHDLDVKMPGKESNKTGKQRSNRKRPQKCEPYIIDDDSESSLSEVESRRPLPSPSARPLPPWQRRRSTQTPIRTVDNLKTSDSFSCMSGRNDVIGGSGAGVNGFRLSNKKGDDSKSTTAKRKPRKSSSSSAASGSSSKKASTSTAASATSKTRKRTRTASSNAASKAPAKKRKRRSYRKSSKRSSRGRGGGRAYSKNNNNAWSARERGVRQPYRRGGGESAPYMAITKQEPMLRNVGGASIQF
mmetsp:Transcript_3876/g.8514  ORF Transcript_3876/g.8514 Transcript_3876/m.8514 type:complete len:510 (-) Transcript_3876:34-1563(-)